MLAPSSPSSRRIGGVEDNKDKRNAKSCNCKKSNCLKLYCECFANGVYCQIGKCNCVTCLNNLENNAVRNQAVESTLERNPNSFRSKMFINDKSNDKAGKNSSSKVHKGCHCKKSNCLKKYCECFQAGIVCTDRCRCLACKNYDGSAQRIEAAAKVELKEKQTLLEMQQNNELQYQRFAVTSTAPNISQLLETNLHSSNTKSSTSSVNHGMGDEEQKQQLISSADIPILSNDNIKSVCKLLRNKCGQVMRNSVPTKRKAPEPSLNDNQPPSPNQKSTNACLDTEAEQSANGIKQVALSHFSEHFRELIVQSLASTISENRFATSSSSGDVSATGITVKEEQAT